MAMTVDEIMEVIEDIRYHIIGAPKPVFYTKYDEYIEKVQELMQEPEARPFWIGLKLLVNQLEALKTSRQLMDVVLTTAIEDEETPELARQICQETYKKFRGRFADE